MSGHPPDRRGADEGAGASGDPSMEDILASIRRILSEDEANPEPAAEAPLNPPAAPKPPPDVLALDPSMLVEEQPEHTDQAPAPNPLPEPHLPPLPAHEPEPEPPAQNAAPPEDHSPMPAAPEPQPAAHSQSDSLVAPEAAAAAASSVGSLLRTIGTRHGVAVTRGGPTIEDLVREELRPALKAWLDANLPPLVERLVRAEIERVVGRADI